MLSLAFKNILYNKIRFSMVIIAIALSIGTIFVFLTVEAAIHQKIYEETRKQTPLSLIRVYPKAQYLNLAKIGDNTSNITSAKFEKIQQLPNLKNVYREIVFQGPASLETTLFGQKFETDSRIFGIEKEMIKDDLKNPEIWNNTGDFIPLIIPQKILDLYNLEIAPNHGLPKVTKDDLVGKKIEIFLNRSIGFPNLISETKKLQGKIAGFSDLVSLSGISIPIGKVLSLNNQAHNQSLSSQLIVEVIHPDRISETAKIIESMDLQTEYLQKKVSEIEKNFYLLKITFLVIEIIVGLIALISIINTFISLMNERRKEFGMFQILGARKQDLLRLIGYESFILGIGGGLLGITLGITGLYIIEKLLFANTSTFLQAYLPKLTLDPKIVFYCFSLGISITLISVIFSSIHLLRSNPINNIKKGYL